MVSGTKFYIYGGGKWREVDLCDGRVEGWGRAKFVYPKRGKVHVAKTPAVLAALRDLNAGRNSTVKDGPHLPHKKTEIIKYNERNLESTCEHSHCCHHQHSNNNRCVPSKVKQTSITHTGIQFITKADAGIQTSLPSQTLSVPETFNKQNSRKRRRETTSSDENAPTKLTTMAMVHGKSSNRLPRFVLPKKRPTAVRSEQNVSVHTKKIPSLKLNKADADKYNIYQRKRSDSTDSIVWVVLPKNEDINEKLNSKQITEYTSTDLNKTTAKKLTDDSRFSSKSKIQSQSNIKSSKAQKKREYRSHSKIQKATRRSESSSNASSSPQTILNVDRREDQCKELIIDEKDVEILRNYLVKHASDFDLLKFDQDDEYKKHFFFKINPLVNVERCSKIARMLQSESQDEISLMEFASQLGLKSVSEQSVPKRYRMRKLKEARRYLERDRLESEMYKENSEKYLRIKHRKGNDKLEKYKNIESKTYKSHSSESVTRRDSLKENHNDRGRKKTERLNKALKESNKTTPSTRHETRKSNNSQKREFKEIFSSQGYDKMRKSDDDSDDSEILGSSKKVDRKGQIKINKRKNFTLYLTDSEDSDDSDLEAIEPSNEPNKKGQNVKDNINVTIAKDENTEKDVPKSSKKSDKISQNERNNNKKNISVTNKNKTDVDDTKSSKYPNVKNKTKIQNEKKYNKRNDPKNTMELSSGEEFTITSKDSNRCVQEKVNNSKLNANMRKNIDLTNSNEESSDAETPKSSNDSNQNRNQKNKTNNTDYKALNGKSSDKYINKTSKESNRGVQNKSKTQNKENKRRNTDDGNSDDETLKSLKDLSKSGRNKVNKNKFNNINNEDSNADKTEIEVSKSLTKSSERVQNKTDSNINTRMKIDHNENAEVPKLRSHLKNQSKANSTKNTTTDTLELNSDNESGLYVKKNGGFVKAAAKEVKTTMVGSKRKISRQSSSGFREYSNLEDHAILTWVSVGGRASCVNGNRIWQELQDQFERIAGQSRSWHSLRNRYLRYILPKLGQYALPQSQETRLRAAAATGEIKSRKRAPRRNSIFAAPSHGALSRRPGTSRSLSSEPEPPPKRHKHDHTRRESSTSPKRVLRSSLPHKSPEKSRHSPRYSDITRRFAEKNRRDNSTPSASPRSRNESPSKKSPTKNSVNEERRESYDKRSLSKDSFRIEVLPSQNEKSPIKEKLRSRRLYNPNAMR